MKRATTESEIVRWFSHVLGDPSLQRIDDFKNGAHLVQLIHSLNPLAFDLARCDFIAKTSYHFERNFKLLQEFMAKEILPASFVVERLMEGDKQKDLFGFCSYMKSNYEVWKGQMVVHNGKFPKKEMYGDYVLLPANKSRGGPSSTAGSASNGETSTKGPAPAPLVPQFSGELIRAAQEAYDPAVERHRAQEKRKLLIRPRRSGELPGASETQSARSGSTSKSIHSAFSHPQSAPGGAAASTAVLAKFVGAQSLAHPSSIENWALQVQTPTRGSSPTDGTTSPLAAVTAGASVAPVTSSHIPHSAGNPGPHDTSSAQETFNPPPQLAILPQPPTFTQHCTTTTASAPPAAAPNATDPPPLLRYNMNFFGCLKSLRPWTIIDAHHDDAFQEADGTPSTSPKQRTQDLNAFTASLAVMNLAEIVDVDGEGVASAEFVSLEELLRRKVQKDGSVKGATATTVSGAGHRNRSVVAGSPSDSTVSMGPSTRQSTAAEEDAWDAFDDLVLKPS